MSGYSCKAVTVYCSSSNHVEQSYFDVARSLGEQIAENGYTLVFGGGKVGLMGALSAGARARGGKVVSVILQRFVEMGVADLTVTEMRVVADMRSRKQGLEEAGDAYIALPGGFGTLEEILEVLSFKQLGFHQKPVVLLNVNGYFDALIDQFERAFVEEFIRPNFRSSYTVVDTPRAAIEAIRNYRFSERPTKFW